MQKATGSSIKRCLFMLTVANIGTDLAGKK